MQKPAPLSPRHTSPVRALLRCENSTNRGRHKSPPPKGVEGKKVEGYTRRGLVPVGCGTHVGDLNGSVPDLKESGTQANDQCMVVEHHDYSFLFLEENTITSTY
jgi:hypothetical protein